MFKKHWGLIISLALGLAAYLGLVTLHRQTDNLTHQYVSTTLTWYGLAFIAYLIALLWAEWRSQPSLKTILIVAALFRILLLFTRPTLSDDIYRYIWDGYVANNGVSPYAYAIDAPELDYLDTPSRALANHAWMASPYLPAAQALFASLTRLFPLRPIFFQAAMILFDMLTGLLIIKLLALAQLPGYRSLLYLWNPLVVVEVAHGAHVDAWMIFLMMLALWLTFTPRYPKITPWLAPLGLAGATLTKGLPILIMPILFWLWSWPQLAIWAIAIAISLLSAGLRAGWGLTGPLDGLGLFGALRIYADQWNFNSGLFHALETNLQELWSQPAAFSWAKRFIGVMMLTVLGGVWLKARKKRSPRTLLRLMAIPFMAYVLLTPTLHPWYLLSLLAFLPFLAPDHRQESRWQWLALAPWLYLSGAIALSYVTYINPQDYREYPWVRHTEWWPTLALATIAILFFVGKKIKVFTNQ